MTMTSQSTPRRHEFAIGRQAGDEGNRIGILKRLEPVQGRQVLHGLLENYGPSAYVFEVRQGVPATGTVTFDADAADAETIILDDGPSAAETFEYDTGGGVTGTPMVVSDVTNREELAAAFAAAVNASSATDITARVVPSQGSASGLAPVVELTNGEPGTAGNVALAGTYGGTKAGMTGGTGAVHAINDADGTSVTSITVQPGGRVEFTWELAVDDLEFLTFNASGGDDSFGKLTITYTSGDLELRTTYT